MSKFVEKLIENSRSGIYPMHMPGHKRRTLPFEEDDTLSQIRAIDISEIEGFDNLHKPEGIIKELEERCAGIFGAKHSALLINGSTGGILAAISACTRSGGKLIMSRNSHKCAYNAVNLGNLKSEYIYPDIYPETGIAGGVTADAVERCICENPDAQAVYITSPTYDGIISDVESIARIAHDNGMPLIVDEAHGAHLGLYAPFVEKYGMQSAIKKGADIVIQSLHKTLPAFTQTAVLHYRKGLVDEDRLKRCLAAYQSSSPSYILLAGIDRCLDIIEGRGSRLFEDYDKNLIVFHEKAKELKNLSLLRPMSVMGRCGAAGYDIGKIVILAPRGKGLYETLINECGIHPEMYGGGYVIAMTSIMDNEDAFTRLYKALKKCDGMYGGGALDGSLNSEVLTKDIRPERVMSITEALDGREPVDDAGERLCDPSHVCRNFIYAYPPGVPVMVPGELFTPELLARLEKMNENGLKMIYE